MDDHELISRPGFGYSNQPTSILRYGITLDEYHAMLGAQRDCCAICGREALAAGGLVIDHDHDTQKVRGLLCRACNSGLGCFVDNPLLLQAAQAYLNARGWWGTNPPTPEERANFEEMRREGIIARHRFPEERRQRGRLGSA